MPFIVILLLSLPHNLCAKVEIKGEQLRIEAWFDNETPADGAKVRLLLQNKLVNETTTDERGFGYLSIPKPGDYLLEVNAGGGHKTAVTFTIEAAWDDLTAGADKQSVIQHRWFGTVIGLMIISTLTIGTLYFKRKT